MIGRARAIEAITAQRLHDGIGAAMAAALALGALGGAAFGAAMDAHLLAGSAGVLATVWAIVATLRVQHGWRAHEWLLFAAPLYGRELARALAVAPALMAMSLPLGVLAGASRIAARPLDVWITVAAAALLPSLVTLSATLRTGRPRWLYLGMATAAGAIPTAAGILDQSASTAAGLVAVLAATGYLALRAFAETLARYDPWPPPVGPG